MRAEVISSTGAGRQQDGVRHPDASAGAQPQLLRDLTDWSATFTAGAARKPQYRGPAKLTDQPSRDDVARGLFSFSQKSGRERSRRSYTRTLTMGLAAVTGTEENARTRGCVLDSTAYVSTPALLNSGVAG
jgi:hypothetical protein